MSVARSPLVRRRSTWLVAYTVLLATSAIVQVVRDRPDDAGDRTAVFVLPVQGRHGVAPGETTRVAIRESGPGVGGREEPIEQVVVLLHGSPGSVDDFRRLQPLLSDEFRVISVDLPGFGASARWVPDYGIDVHARYVLTLLDRLDIDAADVVGFSMGSGVALELADLAPSRIRSVTMICGIGVQEGEGTGDYAFEHLKYLVGYVALVVVPELVPHFGLLGRRSSRHAFIRNFMDTDQRPLRGVLESMEQPLLILHGRRDFLVPSWTGASITESSGTVSWSCSTTIIS